MNSEKTTLKIIEVEAKNFNPNQTYIHNGVLHVNALNLPPVNSIPVKAIGIIIHTSPEHNILEGEKLLIDYKQPAASTSNTAGK